MGLSALGGTVAATDLACDDGGTQSMFGAPIGGIDAIGLKEERENRREFDREMSRKAARDVRRSGMVDEGIELIVQSDRDAMGGDVATQEPVAHAQGVQEALDTRRKPALVIVAAERATPPQQMRETGLRNGAREAPIGRPAVAHEDIRKSAPSTVAASSKPRPG